MRIFLGPYTQSGTYEERAFLSQEYRWFESGFTTVIDRRSASRLNPFIRNDRYSAVSTLASVQKKTAAGASRPPLTVAGTSALEVVDGANAEGALLGQRVADFVGGGERE